MYFALSVQAFSGVIGLVLAVMIRKSKLLIVVHCILGLLSILGFLGYRKRNSGLIITHGYITSILALALFVYQTIQQVLVQGNYMDFFLTLPFAVDLAVGIMSLLFMRKLWKENEETSEIPGEAASDDNTELSNNLGERLLVGKDCCVCKAKPAVMLMYSCGHKCVCAECCEVFRKGISKCPLCRRTIADFLRVYD